MPDDRFSAVLHIWKSGTDLSFTWRGIARGVLLLQRNAHDHYLATTRYGIRPAFHVATMAAAYLNAGDFNDLKPAAFEAKWG